MKAVWLSSTYYLDEAVENLSPTAERFMLRAMAYCGNAETSGFLSKSAIKMLGLPNPHKLVRELVEQEILTPQEDGRWYFRSWIAWQSGGESLLERRKADRERQSRLRESRKQSRDMSRDTSRYSSRDVTPPEESRGDKNSGDVKRVSTDSTNSSRDPHPYRCSNHPHGTTKPCRGCEAARHISEGVEHERIERQRAQREAEQQDALEAKLAAIAVCDLCDGDGYQGTRVCDHIDRTSIARDGAKRARAALESLPPRPDSHEPSESPPASATAPGIDMRTEAR